MKRLLFDLDNTLIKWKDEYTIALQKTIEEFNIDIDYHVIDAVIEKQEKDHDMMNKEVLLNDINEETGLNLDMSFIERLFEHQKYIADIDDDVIETLEYLKDKYDIVLLTNYFIEPQIGRLKKVGIDKYFSRFIGGDMVLIKPHKEAFLEGVKDLPLENVTMIGDSVECDVKGALAAGINIIQMDYFNKYEDNSNWPIARKFSDLKKYL
ncbi:MAG: HAD family hydrolase [Bacilli bacterium]|nr:HAD family hydrolase [Bacilli bacterium]